MNETTGTNISQIYDYSPFGELMDLSPTSSEPHVGFGGLIRPKEHDYLHMGARMYDPTIGRFMQSDPLVDLFPNQSSYNYAYNSPLIWQDPSGLAPEKKKNSTELLGPSGGISNISYRVRSNIEFISEGYWRKKYLNKPYSSSSNPLLPANPMIYVDQSYLQITYTSTTVFSGGTGGGSRVGGSRGGAGDSQLYAEAPIDVDQLRLEADARDVSNSTRLGGLYVNGGAKKSIESSFNVKLQLSPKDGQGLMRIESFRINQTGNEALGELQDMLSTLINSRNVPLAVSTDQEYNDSPYNNVRTKEDSAYGIDTAFIDEKISEEDEYHYSGWFVNCQIYGTGLELFILNEKYFHEMGHLFDIYFNPDYDPTVPEIQYPMSDEKFNEFLERSSMQRVNRFRKLAGRPLRVAYSLYGMGFYFIETYP